MSTQANTNETVSIIVTADTAVVKSISTMLDAKAKVEAAQAGFETGYIGIAKAALPVIARQGYTEKSQVSELFRLSFLSQAGLADIDLNDKAAVAKRDELLASIKSDISNLTAIALPKDEAATKGRDLALKYNDSLPKGSRPNLRIGQKHMLAIVRGQSTAEDVIAVKEGRTPEKPTPAAGGTSKTPTSPEAGANAEGSTELAPTPDGQTTPVETSHSAPAAAGEVIKDAKGAFKDVLGKMIENYKTNLGMSPEDIKAVLSEALASVS